MTIKESRDLLEMKREELQAPLKARELRLKQINLEKVSKQALHTELFQKLKEGSSNNNKGKENGRGSGIKVMVQARIQEVRVRQA